MFPDDFVEQENGFVGLAVSAAMFAVATLMPNACSSLDPVLAGRDLEADAQASYRAL